MGRQHPNERYRTIVFSKNLLIVKLKALLNAEEDALLFQKSCSMFLNDPLHRRGFEIDRSYLAEIAQFDAQTEIPYFVTFEKSRCAFEVTTPRPKGLLWGKQCKTYVPPFSFIDLLTFLLVRSSLQFCQRHSHRIALPFHFMFKDSIASFCIHC